MPITVLMSVISIHVEKVSAFYLSLLLQSKCKHNAIQILLSINQNLKKNMKSLSSFVPAHAPTAADCA